jgi:hypothetical protein
MVTKLVHYTSKFAINEDGRNLKQQSSTRNRRLSSTLDLTDKFVSSQITINFYISTEPVHYLDQMKIEDFV